jgi:hypothetical protein
MVRLCRGFTYLDAVLRRHFEMASDFFVQFFFALTLAKEPAHPTHRGTSSYF